MLSVGQLLHNLSLDPGLESVVKVPAALLQLKGSKILLKPLLLVVEGEEQTLRVQNTEVLLAHEHRLAREPLARLNIPLNALLVSRVTEERCFLHRERTLHSCTKVAIYVLVLQ